MTRTWFCELVFVMTLSAFAPSAQAQSPRIVCETFGSAQAARTVVFLHGAGGPDRYTLQARELASHGFYVLFPHYYDASKTKAATDANYALWVQAVEDSIAKRLAQNPQTKVSLYGISLGASVAMAVGTQLATVQSVVEWSGSLPDFYFDHLKRLPPVLILHGAKDTNVPVINAQQLVRLCERMEVDCEGKIYPEEAHVFDPEERADAERRAIAFLQQDAQPAADASKMQ